MLTSKNRTKDNIKLVTFGILLALIFAMIAFLPRLAVPLFISYMMYLILTPLLQKLIKLGLSRTSSSIVILVGLIFFSTYPIVKIIPVISNETTNIQYYTPKIEKYLKTEYTEIKQKIYKKTGFELKDNYIADAFIYIRTTSSNFLLALPNLLSRVLEWIFVIPLFVFFLLKDFSEFKKKFIGLAPNSVFEKLYFITHQFNKQLGDYIFAKFIEASIIGFIITTGLYFLDVRFALIFGMIAFLTNVIPYLGPLLGAVPALIFGIVEYGVGTTFGGLALLYLIANAIDIAIVFPILVSKIVDLHPVIVVASVIIGSQFLGIVGMIISIPVAAACKLIFTEIISDIYTSNT